MDRYFTSVSLAAWILENNFTIVETTHYNRKVIAKEVKARNDKGKSSVLQVYHQKKNIMLVSLTRKNVASKI